jgi:hypothetical protein
MWGHGLDRSGSVQGHVVDTCEPSGSIKNGEFDYLRTGLLLKRNCAPWSK